MSERHSHKWIINNLDKAEVIEMDFRKLEAEIEKWRQQQKDDYAIYNQKVLELRKENKQLKGQLKDVTAVELKLGELEAELRITKDLLANHDDLLDRAVKAEKQIGDIKQILDLADFEDLTGAHKIHWSNWQSLRSVLNPCSSQENGERGVIEKK